MRTARQQCTQIAYRRRRVIVVILLLKHLIIIYRIITKLNYQLEFSRYNQYSLIA